MTVYTQTTIDGREEPVQAPETGGTHGPAERLFTHEPTIPGQLGGIVPDLDTHREHGPHDGLMQAHRDAARGDRRARACIGALSDEAPGEVAEARTYYQWARCCGLPQR